MFTMKMSDLYFDFPEELTAQTPSTRSRVLNTLDGRPEEITIEDLLVLFKPGDLLVINDTKVLKRRVFTPEAEILFIKELNSNIWEVLFPVRGLKIDETLSLPEGLTMTLKEKSRPQKVQLSKKISEEYFEKYGEVPLPPYIQKSRNQRHSLKQDDLWYQTVWAKHHGSLAAPTAGLHFSQQHLEKLRENGVIIHSITLHVGLGTFLPIQGSIENHQMHKEWAFISRETWQSVLDVKNKGGSVWALGTTVARTLESVPLDYFSINEKGDILGETQLFIKPGFDFKIVDRLLTNFHQPESTLLALVYAFSGMDYVKSSYQWAIKKKFRLFSYGDLSVWSLRPTKPV